MAKSDYSQDKRCPTCNTLISNRASFCRTHFMGDKPHKSRREENYSLDKKCIDCGKLITDKATRCDVCNGIKKRTIFGKKTFSKGNICQSCGNPISNKAIKCRSCSKYGLERPDMKKERNHMWTGGWVGYYGPNWYFNRNRAFERDEGKCVLCGFFNKKNHVHHQIPFNKCSSYVEANEIKNLVTVCFKCHKALEFQDIDYIHRFIVSHNL